MAWDPTHPTTSGAVVSAPLRDNFAALNTQLMAPLIAAPVEQVLKVGAGDTLAGIAAGSNGQVLTLAAGVPTWSTPAFVSPMTAVGDLITGATAGAAQRLAIGTTGHVLTAVGGVPGWQALPVDPGFANPLTTLGDLLVGQVAGTPSRFAAVATGAVLASAGVATMPVWTGTPTLAQLTVTGDLAGAAGVSVQNTGTCAVSVSPAGGHNVWFWGGGTGAAVPNLGGIQNVTLGKPLLQWGGVGRLAIGLNAPISATGMVNIAQTDAASNWSILEVTGAAATTEVLTVTGNSTPNTGRTIVRVVSTGIGTQMEITDSSTSPILMRLSGGGFYRALLIGATDSGGAGFRMLRVAN